MDIMLLLPGGNEDMDAALWPEAAMSPASHALLGPGSISFPRIAREAKDHKLAGISGSANQSHEQCLPKTHPTSQEWLHAEDADLAAEFQGCWQCEMSRPVSRAGR